MTFRSEERWPGDLSKSFNFVPKMNRKDFLKALAILPAIGATMKLSELNNLTRDLGNSDLMPALFLGHGSPMNAIEENEFVSGFRKVGSEFSRP
jgi:4,5-DOPA dioxygenase extradiol